MREEVNGNGGEEKVKDSLSIQLDGEALLKIEVDETRTGVTLCRSCFCQFSHNSASLLPKWSCLVATSTRNLYQKGFQKATPRYFFSHKKRKWI